MRFFDAFHKRHYYLILGIILLPLFHGNILHSQNFSTGGTHTMFVCADGELTGSGNNAYGQMGINDYIPLGGIQTLAEGKWMMVSCGSAHTLFIKSDSTLWASGKGGLLGLDDYVDREEPVQIGTENDWVFVEAGVYTSFGIKKDGTLWSWGSGINGQLGLNGVFEALVPTQIGLSDNWLTVAAAQEYTIGLQKDGTLWGWGENTNGKLGDGTSISKLAPASISLISGWSSIAVAEGGHSLALDDQGFLWGTGLNNFGQLGISQETYLVMEWTLLDTTNQYLVIATGKDHSLVIRDDLTLWATGRNEFGQLGIGSTENSFGFVQVGDESNWELVAASSSHSLAISSDNKLHIWGKNKDWEMPSCDLDGSFQCNQPLLIEDYCGSTSVSATLKNVSTINKILYYPSPVQDVMYFDKEDNFDYITLFDISGKTVFHSETVSKSIDLSFLQSGIFILEMGKDGIRYQQRIVKE